MQRIATDEEIRKYHTKEIFDYENDIVINYELILDENDNPISLDICLCFAREPGECACRCTGWEYWCWE